MKRRDFVDSNIGDWDRLEEILNVLDDAETGSGSKAYHDYLSELAINIPPGLQRGMIGTYYQVRGDVKRFYNYSLYRVINIDIPSFLADNHEELP